MKKSFASFILLAFGFIFTQCYYDKKELLYPQVGTECDTTNVTYNPKITNILSGNCYSCHGNGVAASLGGGIKLQNYADVKEKVSRIYGAITHQSGYLEMPRPIGSPMLDSCSIKLIRIWIAAGAPNN